MGRGRILITGADGFVGGHLQRHFRQHMPDAQLFAFSGPGGAPDTVLDITDAKSVEEAVQRCAPDHIIHLAAMAAVTSSHKRPDLAFEINTLGTMNLIRAMEAHAPDGRLVFASSSEIYGRSFKSGKALDETAPLAPANPYAISKAAADLAVQEAAHRSIRATILRLFNHTGPGQGEAFVLPSFAAQIARIEAGQQAPVMHVGNLSAERDFLDIGDVLDAYRNAIEQAPDLEPCEVFNIASGQSRSIRSLLDKMLEGAQTPIKVELDPARLRPSDTPRALGNPARAKAVLGWSPRRSIDDTIMHLLNDHRARLKMRDTE